ncbi:hypothetical protein BC828DRAFT_371883 [Blastocladiella britannica]|nr:hypothetical protein BC828DRAFT_371883 [Blastocladiella britannica]
MALNDTTLFKDLFVIDAIDQDGKRFDRVSRLTATSDSHNAKITLDFNNELYPLKQGERIAVHLTSSLALPSSSAAAGGINAAEAEAVRDSWRPTLPSDPKDLSEDYDYVMHGRCFKYDEESDGKVYLYILPYLVGQPFYSIFFLIV